MVGSGAGGATTAALLAEAGLDVLIVEEGAWVDQGDVVPFSLEQMDRQYRAGGVTVALGRPSIAYTEGCCAGGGTEINSGLYRRPSEETLDRWRDRRRSSISRIDEFFATCDEIERALSVQTVPGRYSAASDETARRCRNARVEARRDPALDDLPHGRDATAGERQSMTRTFLPRALAAGARMLVEHRVDRLVSDRRRAFRAELTGPEGAPCTIDFERVVVCAGAIQTPALLQRSGFRGLVGKGLAVHPTVKLAARFDDAVNVVDDVPVHQVKEFAPDLSFGGSASQPGLVALALSDHWPVMRDAVTSWREIAVYYAAITSEGRGRVAALPGAPRSTRHVLADRSRPCAARAGLGAAGTGDARRRRRPRCTRRSAGRRSFARGATWRRCTGSFAATAASVMTVHLCSTVPMGEDRTRRRPTASDWCTAPTTCT